MNPIQEFHNLTKKYPERFSKKIHRMVFFIDLLLQDKGVEYRPADPEHFQQFCFDYIVHIEGIWAGMPFVLSLEQKWIVHCILGIKIKDKTYKVWVRYFREGMIFVARKWGKTLFASALEIWFTLCDKEPAAAVYNFASNSTQAARLFGNAKYFIEHNRILRSAFKFSRRDNKQFAYVKGTANFFSYESGTPKGKTGSNPHLAIFDELHEITKKELYKNVTTGQATRLQPFALSISSAGKERGSLYDDKLTEIENICKKKKLPEHVRLFFAVFEIDAEDNPDNEKCWIKANPGLPDNRPGIAYLRKEHKSSQLDITERPSFLAFHLNRPTNNALTYIELDELKNARIDIRHEMYYDSYGFGGTDLSQTTDLCSATALIPMNPECTRFIFLQKYFVAEKRIDENSERDKILYKGFTSTISKDPICRELLHICKGAIVDKEDVVNWYIELEEKYKITFLKIGYDAWDKTEYLKYSLRVFSAENVTKDDDGLDIRDDGVMTAVHQGPFTMSDPIKYIKTEFKDEAINYDATNVLFEFCVNNLKVEVDKNKNVSIHKAKSTGRVDGFASLADAVVAMERGKAAYVSLEKTHNPYQSGKKVLTI